MQPLNNADDPPVTIHVLHRVKPGCEATFEQVLGDLITAAHSYEGHLGVNVFRSGNNTNPEYQVVFKFDQGSHFKQWESSAIRQQLLTRVNQLTVDAGQISVLTGLETWFTLPTKPGLPPPPRYKMFVITWATIFVLISLMNQLVIPLLHSLPSLLGTLIVTGLMVFLMTYVVMPRITKLFAQWLYPKAKH
ncbi:antibiotic biosynthesis monooxygenase [Leptolyngbya sp. FACHB-261]|uniref:antibiotic biosynthesis monooxygenase n=1 Tax=Leptolyngbya sp. FACHB-261 TaxID=2692806 RepID=UPI0016844C6E|nr:antibiotic biosynthesis monooxygenase [Leptolyngbya sp. FACHB-261]MBD2102494.1 antibiotic biosynthesis monooxygenase [Leptolyngbya sp. FACHB-261]